MSQILRSVIKGVGSITLNRPEHGNAITASMMQELFASLDDFQGNPEVRVITITGAGKYFCTGMDLKGNDVDFSKTKPYAPFEKIWGSTKPVIGIINGPALGGGVGIMFSCDIRVMAKDAHIAFPEVSLGIFPALISGYIAPQLGPYLTQSLMLTGQAMTALELLNHGVVTSVAIDKEELAVHVASIVAKLMSGPVSSHAGVKRLIRLINYCGEYHVEVMDALVQEFQAMMRSPEARFGMKSFGAKKEKPDWTQFYASNSGTKKTDKSKL